jgi:hypothetical protein
MPKISVAIGKKVLSLALIFNSVVSLVSAINMLASFYIDNYQWRPYSPYLIDGSFLWFIVLTAVLNISPAKSIGKVKIGRILFHHYVYGFLATSISLLLIVIYAPAYVILLLMPSLGFQTSGFQTIPVYAGLFFIYGGLTLVIDDMYDMSLGMGRMLDGLKMRLQKSGRTLQAIHLCSGLMSTYVLMCGILWYLDNDFWVKSWPLWDASHIIFMSSLLVTNVWALKAVKGRLWFTKSSSIPKKK